MWLAPAHSVDINDCSPRHVCGHVDLRTWESKNHMIESSLFGRKAGKTNPLALRSADGAAGAPLPAGHRARPPCRHLPSRPTWYHSRPPRAHSLPHRPAASPTQRRNCARSWQHARRSCVPAHDHQRRSAACHQHRPTAGGPCYLEVVAGLRPTAAGQTPKVTDGGLSLQQGRIHFCCFRGTVALLHAHCGRRRQRRQRPTGGAESVLVLAPSPPQVLLMWVGVHRS